MCIEIYLAQKHHVHDLLLQLYTQKNFRNLHFGAHVVHFGVNIVIHNYEDYQEV